MGERVIYRAKVERAGDRGRIVGGRRGCKAIHSDTN